jgi:hypothetical protein
MSEPLVGRLQFTTAAACGTLPEIVAESIFLFVTSGFLADGSKRDLKQILSNFMMLSRRVHG